jgi:hypothetical protein
MSVPGVLRAKAALSSGCELGAEPFQFCLKAQVNTLNDLFHRLSTCWKPPPASVANPMDITVSVIPFVGSIGARKPLGSLPMPVQELIKWSLSPPAALDLAGAFLAGVLPFHRRFFGCAMRETFEPSPRDILIHRVRVGEITPEEAEIEAQHLGVGPLATKPNPIDFEPAQMPYWSLPMALAWIAWRNIEQVREHCAEYRENWLSWFQGSWNVPTDDGKEFRRIDGYELRSSRRSTVLRLARSESYLSSTETLPSTCQMTIAKAEKELLFALAAGHLVAIAKDSAGKVVDIPQREWPYLELFEEQECDVLKHDALDAIPAFTEVKLGRKDLQRLWEEFLVQPYMIEPMNRAGTAGYVAFCAALHWIMTEGGTASKSLEDFGAWNDGVQQILPLISTGEIQVIGRPAAGGSAQNNHG